MGGQQPPPIDLTTKLLLEFDTELDQGRMPDWSVYLGRCRTAAERLELLDDMISVETQYLGWEKERVRSRLRLLARHHASKSKLAAVIRGLYADRLKTGECPSLDDCRGLGVSMDRLKLRAENEAVFLGCVVAGRYRLEKVLGRGGFGVVYQACDRSKNRFVAVKTVHGKDNAKKRQARRLLKEEGEALRKLTHRGVPRFIDLVVDRSTPCLVLEYVDGGTLVDVFKQGPVMPERAARIIAAIADTLHFVHRKGYTHRDLKLTNVLIDKEGRPYLADFGLALPVDDQFDRDGECVHSAGYSSVENFMGAAREIDGRTDVFSAGVILYELLTGKTLMSGECREDSLVEAALLDQRILRFPQAVPRKLREICRKCLWRNPNDRYHTAGHLKSALDAFLAEVSHGEEKIVAAR